MSDIASFIQEIAILTVPVLMAITFHEVAHGYSAYLLGDPTAKNAGRLTLNPIKHLDPIGAIALFLVKVGWAKPVPINPQYFRQPRSGIIIVSFAGPLANFILAFAFSLAFQGLLFVFGYTSSPLLQDILKPVLYMCQAGVLINIGLGIFNLLPIPPLDGSNILAGLLPSKISKIYMDYSKYGFILLIILLVAGVGQKIFIPIIKAFGSLLLPM